MEIKPLLPRRGEGTLRIDDSDDLVVIEKVGSMPEGGSLPEGGIYAENHAVIIICTEGMAQFEYEGQTIQLHKNDMFIYMVLRSVVSNFMSSQNFNCRQIWFTANEAWSIDMHGNKSLADLIYLKQHPKLSLTEHNAELIDGYFQLLCRRMRDRTPSLFYDIVRSLFSTMLLEVLALMRGEKGQDDETESANTSSLHRQRLADKFMQLVEESDGRIRKVDDFANQLNVTPKYLSTLLKETMNRRPSEVIRFFTLKGIQHRLRFTDMTMQEIANDMKFPNASFFGKYFKEHAGMTPLEFRRKYHK
ncbi:MAG: helix-turn-helix domain-containing protein [Prevotella sp.]|nr:helix-turn-helix domain-containing protein [Prevotella sp.]